MSNGWFKKGVKHFGQGNVAWKASGGSTIRMMLVDGADYIPDLDAHEWFSDVPLAARLGNAGGTGRTDMPALTLFDAADDGILDAADAAFTGIPADSAHEYLVLFKDGGSDGASQLLLIFDTATGLPITPNGANIDVTWPNGADKIAKL